MDVLRILVSRACARLTIVLLLAGAATLRGQGVTTAGIRGLVRERVGDSLRVVANARVLVRHEPTGSTTEARVANGRFFVEGLRSGGPYTVTVRAIGLAQQRTDSLMLELGELRVLNFDLMPAAVSLETVRISTERLPRDALTNGGIGTVITDSLLARLPSLDRDLYDFVQLVPQISTKIGLPNPGFSAAGASFRYNSFLINGVSERTLSGGVSGAFAGSQSIPMDAVKEYQVLTAPYDVRYGDFAGAMVNTVTQAGTNELRGSAFAFARNAGLARHDGSASPSPYDQMQYGLSLGGPIVRDRAHFFLATGFQRATAPADGPYLGEGSGADRPAPVSAATLDRLDSIMRSHALTPGSAGPVDNHHPLRNLFARTDLELPRGNGRLIAWTNYAAGDQDAFSRASRDTFALSSYKSTAESHTLMGALQLLTPLRRAGGGDNDLLLSARSDALETLGAVDQPIVSVTVPGVSATSVTVTTGTNEAAQGPGFRASAFTIADNLSLPAGASHVITLGASVEQFRVRRGLGAGSYGTWSFPSLDAFAADIADRYQVRVNFGNDEAPLHGSQSALYGADRWTVTDRLTVTAGLRGDLLVLNDRAPYNPEIDSIFGRRTDQMPERRVELSPRVGFVWDAAPTREFRGGAGLFTGRYPLAWAHSAVSSYGVGGLLRCNLLGDVSRYPPGFIADPRAAPTSCRGGAALTASSPGDVDLLNGDLRMVRTARGSLAFEQRLPGGVAVTAEGLVSRGLSDVAFVNLNLADPVATDRYGRVMYGTIATTAVASPRTRSGFSEVIDTRSVGGSSSYDLTARVERAPESGFGWFASYTHARARDVETPLRVNTRGTATWATARVVSGRQDDLRAGTSSNDVPHRVIAGATFSTHRRGTRTHLSLSYVGESGRPFTYIAYGAPGRGDLNADGSNADDPIYVPRSALDTTEIAFSGSYENADNSPPLQAAREHAERVAFDSVIASSPCMRRQRGHILVRNSCREPWSNTTAAAVEQTLPGVARNAELRFEIFNLLNLLDRAWGKRREASAALLEHVGQTSGDAATSKPIFRFDTAAAGWNTVPAESSFQIQIGLRYLF